MFSTIPEAIADIRNGQFVIVMDDESRENEGDLIMAAEFADEKKLAFCVNYTTGILCAPMLAARAAELKLPIMVQNSTDPNQTAFTVSTDHISTSTGVSAADRAATFVKLADPSQKAEHFRRPGHIFPLIARPKGVLERRGHTEAAVDLCRLAGVQPIGLIGELVNKDGSMKRLHDCVAFAQKYALKIITIEQLIAHLEWEDSLNYINSDVQDLVGVTLVSQCELPLKLRGRDLGFWTAKCFYSHFDGKQHIVVVKTPKGVHDGSPSSDFPRDEPVLTRIHSECFTGDVLGSQRCDCGDQLFAALSMIAERNRGVVIYNAGHEGRGIGLANKIMAYHLQQQKNLDTYAANSELGFAEDYRKYDTARAIIKALGISKIDLLTTNGHKIDALQDVVHTSIPLEVSPNEHNHRYLEVKRRKHSKTPTPPSEPSDEVFDQKDDHTVVHTNVNTNIHSGVNTNIHSGVNAGVHTNVNQATTAIIQPTPHKFSHTSLLTSNTANSLRIGIIRTSWNEELVNPFASAIRRNLLTRNIRSQNIKTLTVPGSFEIPFAAKILASECDAVICVGLLLKGETMHFEIISQAVAQGLMNVQLECGVPMVNGVLNCLTEEQAVIRCASDSLLVESLASTAVHMATLRQKYIE